MAARISALVLSALLAVSATPAVGADAPGVRGGGFLRAADKTKTTLTISATDEGVLGDKGQAQFVRHTPGSAANPVHINILCTNVVSSLAIASGFGSDGRMYLIVVKDNGEGQASPDQFAVVESLTALPACMTGIVPTDVRLGDIAGGNFQVFSS